MQVLKSVPISGNFVIADSEGNIALQQTGLRPSRAGPSLLPGLGWRHNSAWLGLADPNELHSVINPPEGYIATANNQHIEHAERLTTINIDLGDYRVRRIKQLLEEGLKINTTLSAADMERMQLDVFSLQAQRWMDVLRPLLPMSCEACKELANWDLQYDGSSRGALLFTLFYNDITSAVMTSLFGAEAWKYLRIDGTAFYCLNQRIDDIILEGGSDLSALIKNETRDELLVRILQQSLGSSSPHWQVYASEANLGDLQSMTHVNLFFQGRTGSIGLLLGLDRGPYSQQGSHATVVQGAQGVHYGMLVHAGPVWRYVTDMGENGAWTVLAGGPSGVPGSPWYASELDMFHHGEFKRLQL